MRSWKRPCSRKSAISFLRLSIMETWQDDSHKQSAAMDVHTLFRKDKQGRRGSWDTQWLLCLISISKTSFSLGTQFLELEDRDQEKNKAPIIHREMVSDLTDYWDIHKSMGADGIQPRVLRDVAETFTETIFSIYQQSWLTWGVPGDWRLAKVMPTYKKGRKEHPKNHRPVNLTSASGKVCHRADPLECHHMVHKGQPGAQARMGLWKACPAGLN